MTRSASPACPFSFTATNTENFLCASHPINCSILLQHLLVLGVSLAVYVKPHCSAFIASLTDTSRSAAETQVETPVSRRRPTPLKADHSGVGRISVSI